MNDHARKAVEICNEFVARLRPAVDIVRVYAFGSRIRGDHSPDSDLDIVVELQSVSAAKKRKVRDIAWALGLELELVISTIVVAEADFERGLLSDSLLAISVRRDGIQVAA